MAYDNLPGIFEDVLDGNLTILPTATAPIVIVLGTASQGDSETVYRVDQLNTAQAAFDTTGNLVRGMYEASAGGATNIRLFRIGAKSATLSNIGAGVTIETIRKDGSAGTDYQLTWDDSAGRLRVWDTDETLVYDNNPADPLNSVDLNEVYVFGTFTTGSSADIPVGLLDVTDVDEAVTLLAADGVSSAIFSAGDDGLSMSRMELYEALYNAYELLEDQDVDVVVPMGVYLDDLNVMDMTQATISGVLSLHTLSTYPDPGASNDVLGKLYTEEYEGQNYFWWWFPGTHNSPVFSAANIYPTISGLSNLDTQKTDGTALSASDFHEVNFAYQLAQHCYTQSRDNTEMTGTIGVVGPTFNLAGVSTWIGQLPSTDDSTGDVLVSTNGTGLLGNKFMSGRAQSGSGTTLLPAFTIDSKAGLYNGGFIATDDGWLDGTHTKDSNNHLIDIGKYISVVATYPTLTNSSRTTVYNASGAATYAGFYSALPANSAPTNKRLGSVELPFRVNIRKLDLLAGQRYVTFHTKTRGIVVSDAPTAARPDSDYRRLSTVRQVKASVDRIRVVSEPFLGEGMTGQLLAALDTAIDGELKSLVKQGVISSFNFQIIATPQQRILGQATVELKLQPAFELRQITVVIGLTAV
jgi:hypothetical protein